MDQETFRFKPRNYLHFDLPVSRLQAWKLVSNKERVASHPFYPFIGFTIETPRIKREGRIVRKTIKEREIKIAAHRDAAIYSYYGQLLGEFYEKEVTARGISNAITAFRSLPTGGTNIDFAGEAFRFIKQHRPCVALAYDVEGFFDNLDHLLLRDAWAQLLGHSRLPNDHFSVFRSLSQFSWVKREDAFDAFGISPHNPKGSDGNRYRICSPLEFRSQIRDVKLIQPNPRGRKGIPQGSPMSAVLSNIYMLPFDLVVNQFVVALGGLYRRYCDDILIIVPPNHASEIDAFVCMQLELRRLTFHEGKKHIVSFDVDPNVRAEKTLQYLGFTFDGISTLLRLGSLSRYYGKMRRGVSLAKQTQRKHNRREQKAGKPLTALRRRKLYFQYSYLYDRRRITVGRDPKTSGNFLTYGYKAARKLDSRAIKLQLRGHWRKLKQEIEKPIKNQLREP